MRSGDLTDIERRAMDLLCRGYERFEIAGRLGISRHAANNAIARAREKLSIDAGPVARPRTKSAVLESEISRVDTSGERCKCGLRLPCHGCIPSIDVFAARRTNAD